VSQITQLLGRVQGGDEDARSALFAAAYEDLRRLARARLRSGGRSTLLDTTALVHESYLRFLKVRALRAEDRRAFFAYAAQVMRSVILNVVRERQAQRRGGDVQELVLHTQMVGEIAGDEETVLKVHEALLELEQASPRLAEVALMRYFGGYSETEIAEALEVTERTVERYWQKARLILLVALK